MSTFDPTFPLNATKIRDTPAGMQNNWSAIELGDLTFIPQVVNFDNRTPVHVPPIPIDPSANPNTIRVFNKEDTNGDQQLYAIDENSAVFQITYFPSTPRILAFGEVPLAGGAVINGIGLGSATIGAVSGINPAYTIKFAVGFNPPNDTYSVIGMPVNDPASFSNNRIINMIKSSRTTVLGVKQFSVSLQARPEDAYKQDTNFFIMIICT